MKIFFVFIFLVIFIFSCTVIEKPQQVAEGSIIFLIGEVKVNDSPTAIKTKIVPGDIITTGTNSLVEIKTGENSGIHIGENAQASILLEGKSIQLELTRGSALSLAAKNSGYQVKMPAAVAGVRGTIFYVHAYDDSHSYICTCNGTVDIKANENLLKTVSFNHHEAYEVITNQDSVQLQYSVMKEHDDLMIFEFMYRLEKGN